LEGPIVNSVMKAKNNANTEKSIIKKNKDSDTTDALAVEKIDIAIKKYGEWLQDPDKFVEFSAFYGYLTVRANELVSRASQIVSSLINSQEKYNALHMYIYKRIHKQEGTLTRVYSLVNSGD